MEGAKKGRPNLFEKQFYNYRLISYMIKPTVNKCKHSHDKATNNLLGKTDSQGYQTY